MEELDGVPCKVLGYPIKTRTQIYLSCLVTAILELFVYIVVVTTDICLTVQHFRDGNPLYGSLTLICLCLPALACFCSIIVSPWQWPADNEQCGKENIKFFLKQLGNLFFFPIASSYRYVYLITHFAEQKLKMVFSRWLQFCKIKLQHTQPYHTHYNVPNETQILNVHFEFFWCVDCRLVTEKPIFSECYYNTQNYLLSTVADYRVEFFGQQKRYSMNETHTNDIMPCKRQPKLHRSNCIIFCKLIYRLHRRLYYSFTFCWEAIFSGTMRPVSNTTRFTMFNGFYQIATKKECFRIGIVMTKFYGKLKVDISHKKCQINNIFILLQSKWGGND